MSIRLSVPTTQAPSFEWFANLDNPRTRRAYQNDLEDFGGFVGLVSAVEFRVVTRSHVLAWSADLETRGLDGATIRRKLAAPATLFDQLLENNAVAGGNPVHGVKRPKAIMVAFRGAYRVRKKSYAKVSGPTSR